MQITNEVADIINHYLDDVSETIQSIEDAIQLNKEFNNTFDIHAYLHPYRKYKDDNTLDNWQVYNLWETLYESEILWGFWIFTNKIRLFGWLLKYWYYDYLYRYDKWELQECIDRLTTEEQLQLVDDCICNYYIHKFSLDIKI